MTRTKLMDREMPVYTKNEELFNMISHIVGGVVGIAGMVLCIIFSALHHNGYGLAGSIVFGVSMILLYTMSSVYHGLKPGLGKRVMQVFDHCTIYVLIAGTYTPLLLSAMLLSVAICCGLLNLFLPTDRPWSLYVIGAAVMLWVWFTLPMVLRRLPVFFRLTADVAAIGIYVWLISIDLGGSRWFRGLALPMIGWAFF